MIWCVVSSKRHRDLDYQRDEPLPSAAIPKNADAEALTKLHAAFLRALGVSVAAHALVLGVGRVALPESRLSQPLLATLRPALATPPSPEPVSLPAPPPVKDLKPPPKVIPKRPAEKPKATVRREDRALLREPVMSPPQEVRQAEPAPSAAAPDRAPVDAQPPTMPGSTRSAEPQARSDSGPLAKGLDPDGVREYRWALAKSAERWKRARPYPSVARERGWTGRPEVRVEVREDGVSPSVTVVKGTSHDILDAYAREMFLAAVQSTRVPDSLRGRHFAITIPIRFTLEDEGY